MKLASEILQKKPPLFHIFFLFILDMNLQNVYRTFFKCDFSEFYLQLEQVYLQLEQSINSTNINRRFYYYRLIIDSIELEIWSGPEYEAQ